jgi:hypothetical protein
MSSRAIKSHKNIARNVFQYYKTQKNILFWDVIVPGVEETCCVPECANIHDNAWHHIPKTEFFICIAMRSSDIM